MANVVTTILKFSKVSLTEMCKFLNIHDGTIDFSNIIPVPDHILLDTLPYSRESLDAYKYLVKGQTMNYFLTNLLNAYRNGPDGNDKTLHCLIAEGYIDLKLGRKLYIAEQKYGNISYFNWMRNNWGTSNPIEVRIKHGFLVLETNWNAPVPIIKAIAAHFPNGVFSCVWCDEFADVAGSMELYQGETEEFHADPGSGGAMDCYYIVRKFEEEEYNERMALMKKGA